MSAPRRRPAQHVQEALAFVVDLAVGGVLGSDGGLEAEVEEFGCGGVDGRGGHCCHGGDLQLAV